MSKYEQKTIEYFLKKHKITNPEKKVKILPEITNVIYDYNMLIVKHEKEKDAYKRKQIETDIKELEDKIAEIFKQYR